MLPYEAIMLLLINFLISVLYHGLIGKTVN